MIHPKAEIMRNYSFKDLQKKAILPKLTLGDIVTLKALALRRGWNELAEKLDQAEKLTMKKKN